MGASHCVLPCQRTNTKQKQTKNHFSFVEEEVKGKKHKQVPNRCSRTEGNVMETNFEEKKVKRGSPIRHCEAEVYVRAVSDRTPRFGRAISTYDETDTKTFHVSPEMHDYPFENLVFEGGGNKGLAYCGAIECLEDMKILPNIKRVAGSSAGAITAALVALGYSSNEIFAFMSEDIEDIFLDHSCGYLSLIPNLLRHWGWNPGRRIYKWFGEKIKAQTASKNPDLTFYELYTEKCVELCVVVTNINQMRSEYCHPKTTPDMPIREALRMSMSIPGVFMARVYDNYGQKDTYVDGGVLCNYPIHCFDGWFLSMEKSHSFLLHMQNLKDLPQKWSIKNTFGERNEKTLGFLLYDDTEVEIMRYSLERRINAVIPEGPSKDTKLFKQKQKDKDLQFECEREHSRCVKAAEAFMKALHKHNLHDQVFISKEELKNALEDVSCFSVENKEILFGEDVSVDFAFEKLDRDGNGQIAFLELLHFLELKGIQMQTRIQGYGRIEVNNIVQFIQALQNTWTTNLKNIYVGDEDVNRTVGINTGHVGTSNYVLEDEDITFLQQRGYYATMAFLRYFIILNPNKVIRKSLSTPEDASIDEADDFENTKSYYATMAFLRYFIILNPNKVIRKSLSTPEDASIDEADDFENTKIMASSKI